MKRIVFSLLAITMFTMAFAQDVMRIKKTDGSVVTYNVVDIEEIDFTETEGPTPQLIREVKGYIYVSSAHFTNMYYGDKAVISIYKVGDKNMVKFSDPQWGTAVFNNVTVSQTLSGEGTFSMNNYGQGTIDYPATLSGPMMQPIITIPAAMGGTTITFHVGTAPVKDSFAGTYNGSQNFVMGELLNDNVANQTMVITKNKDNTITFDTPAFSNFYIDAIKTTMSYESFKIANIPYTVDDNGNIVITPTEYTVDGVKYVMGERASTTTVTGTISGTITSDGATIKYELTPKVMIAMGMRINSTFTGTKAETK